MRFGEVRIERDRFFRRRFTARDAGCRVHLTGFVVLGLAPPGSPTTFAAAGLSAGFAFYVPWRSQSAVWQ